MLYKLFYLILQRATYLKSERHGAIRLNSSSLIRIDQCFEKWGDDITNGKFLLSVYSASLQVRISFLGDYGREDGSTIILIYSFLIMYNYLIEFVGLASKILSSWFLKE